MRQNNVKTLWDKGETALCGWIATESVVLAETLGVSGFDAVVIDLQHGASDVHNLMHLMQAVSATPATPMVRLPGNVPEIIMKSLDYGAYGLICPLVNTAEDAKAFVCMPRSTHLMAAGLLQARAWSIMQAVIMPQMPIAKLPN